MKICTFLITLFISVSAFSQVDTVLNRYKQWLLQQGASEKWLHTLDANGQWPDIDYNDTVKANWKILNHLKHLRELAILYTKQPSPRIADAVNRALNHWLQQRYKNSNWWHNQIGVPQCMRDIIVLYGNNMPPAQLKQAMEVLGQYRISGIGANLTWSADLGFHYGALSGDTALMHRCVSLMANEIKISTEEGVQPDYSFHQHGKRLQIYSYGEAFLRENVRLAWQVRGTPWAFPQEKTNILINFVLEGWQWMARGIHTVPGAIDRSVSRPNDLHNANIRRILPLLKELDPAKAGRFTAIENNQNGKGPWLNGFRFFPYSDFTAYHHNDFSFFLKTISTRTLPAESINSENLKGRFMNSGDAYMIQNGKEYFNMMPVWKWDNLPGITMSAGAKKIIRKPFSGGVSDGQYGCTVMDYALDKATAKKFWACYENMVVCLMSGLQADYTVLDQSRQQGKIKKGKNWVTHHNMAYILLQPSTLEVQSGPVSGNWQSINLSQSPEPVTEKVFMPIWKHHGETTGGYVIAYTNNVKQFLRNPGWRVLSNTDTCQAVQFANGTTMMAFWKPGKLAAISVDQPCLLMLANNILYASDPSQAGVGVTVTVGETNYAMALPADGATMKVPL